MRPLVTLLALSLPRFVFAQDSTPPMEAAILIQEGALWSTSTTVSLSLAATDDTGVTAMCVSNTTSCTSWITYAPSMSWNVGSTQGTRTVYAKFRDAAGNVSGQVSDTIGLDSVAPSGGGLSATAPTTGTLALAWSGFTDATSGVASYKVVYATGSSPASKCTSGTLAYEGAETSASLTGLADGSTYYLRVCPVDTAGNVGTGSTTSAVPKAETNAPTGTVAINSGAAWSTTTSVTLSLAATDDTGVTQMCISNSTSCTSWQSYTTVKTWTLSGSGTRTVYVWFKDASGNVSAATSDSIGVDTLKPSNGALVAAAMDQAAQLSWSGFADTVSGIASYTVVRGTSTPSSCNVGTLVYSGADTLVTDVGLSNGTKYYYRVCARDVAGNLSTGATASVTPVSEYDAPNNAVVSINNGAAWVRTSAVTLSLSAEDASGVTKMCISNSTSCTNWQSFAATKSWTLSGSGVTRTVFAWFQDSNGNKTLTPVSDTIQVDTVRPSNGTVSASPGAIAVDLAWSGFTDTTAGVSSYRVVYARSTVPPSTCDLGTLAYSGADSHATVSGLATLTTYAFRVCAVDAAGNTSTGSTVSAMTLLDDAPPTGSLLLDGGAAASSHASATVTLSATDDRSGVIEVCLSEDSGACEDWIPFTEETTWSFSEVEGVHTVYAWFGDGAGNRSATPVSDDLLLDWTAPTDGAVSAEGAGAGTVVLSWSGFSDNLTGISGYLVSYHLDGSLPDACDEGDVITSVSATTLTLTGLSDGADYSIRVCGVDGVGNRSDGATVLARSCTPIAWYADADGDGYGSDTSAVMSCVAPTGYVIDGGDCDDTNATISPAAEEVCDGLDNDCSGQIDDTFDADQDGSYDCDDYALSFDGDDWVELVGTAAISLTDSFTAEVWVRTDSPSNPDVLVVGDHYCGLSAGWFVGFLGGQPEFWFNNDTYAYTARIFGPEINDGDWHVLAATYDGSTMAFYVDGVHMGSKSRTYSSLTGRDWTIGGFSNRACPSYTGAIDNVSLWRTARTAAEVLSDRTSLPTGLEADLISFYDFDEGAGQSLLDLTGGGLDGRLGSSSAEGEGDDPTWFLDDVTSDCSSYTLYADSDGDGYGAGAPWSAYLCATPSGWVTNNADCDDLDAMISPLAEEVIGNGDDEDCDGIAQVTPQIEGSWNHTLYLDEAGTVWGWGRNSDYELGDGTTTARAVPGPLLGLPHIVDIAVSYYGSYAVDSDGGVWSWGYGSGASMGESGVYYRTTPGQVSGLSGVQSIESQSHTFAVLEDGSVVGWGSNDWGKLGDGTSTTPESPVHVSGLSHVISISADYNHSAAVTDDGLVWGWGANSSGQLGTGDTVSRWTPTLVSGVSDAVQVCTMESETLVLRADGTVWGWGGNFQGQLGDGTTTARLTPVQALISDVAALSCRGFTAMAITTSGAVYTWGNNGYGQLGLGDYTARATPTFIGLSDGWLAGQGMASSYLLDTSGALWAWGGNWLMQLGVGDSATYLTPTPVTVGPSE